MKVTALEPLVVDLDATFVTSGKALLWRIDGFYLVPAAARQVTSQRPRTLPQSAAGGRSTFPADSALS